MSETYGYPLLMHFTTNLTLLATPVYGAIGCAGPTYRSLFIVRDENGAETLEELRGGIYAINDWVSQSGMNLWRHTIAP